MKRLLVVLVALLFTLPAVTVFADEGGGDKPAAAAGGGKKVKKGKRGGAKKGGAVPCYAVCKADKKLLAKRSSSGGCKAMLRKWTCSKDDKPVLKGARRGGGKKGGGKKGKAKADAPEKGAAEKGE
ncbi:MAG: hypothetical protein HYY84_11740 [Deltaproteobacteria bacterium]|nr:hypothetical protein [Deltaproteobacteria bacterium]